MTRAMALPRINCNATTAACAATALSLRACVLLVSILITKRRRRVPSTMSTSPRSSTRASLVSSVKTPDGRVCPRNPVTRKTHTMCARSLLQRSEDEKGGTVPRPSTRPADHRRQGHAHGSGRVHGRASGSASSSVSTSMRLTTNKPEHRENFTNKKNLTLKLSRSILTNKHEH